MKQYSEIKKSMLSGNCPEKSEILSLLQNENVYRRNIIIILYFEIERFHKNDFLAQILQENPLLAAYLLKLFECDTIYQAVKYDNTIDEKLLRLIQGIICSEAIEDILFQYAMDSVVQRKASAEFIALFLIEIYSKGLSTDNVEKLTLAMRNTGAIYDYRNSHNKVIRRYPTGAVSEKTALILPSIISCVAKKYHIISPFLVAKTLSFTGGTWDKLSVIPNFSFPHPGVETQDVMDQCGVAMTVAHDDLCPVDTILYQIRSITDTVDSVALAASSIASKQLACPADILLLDVRYGEGAFFEYNEAVELNRIISAILTNNGVDVISLFTPTGQPTGSAIGNRLELCEAISIICNTTDKFDSRAKNEQQDIVLRFYTTIMENVRPHIGMQRLKAEGQQMLLDSSVKNAFQNILLSHGVTFQDSVSLLNNPYQFLGLKCIGEITSKKSGIITKVNQKKLGNIVNFGLSLHFEINMDYGLDSILYSKENNKEQYVNLLLEKRVGDRVSCGDVLAKVFIFQCGNSISDIMKSRLFDEIEKSFTLSELC